MRHYSQKKHFSKKDNNSLVKSTAYCANSQCSVGNRECNLWTECPMFCGTVAKPERPAISKYKAEKVEVLGLKFDSKKEARRWFELEMLEKTGVIKNLRRQVKYELIPAQREPDTYGPRGVLIQGTVIERAVYYIADFVYIENNQIIVEDTKGVKTKEYVIKRKLLLWRYGIKIKEV